MNKEAPAIPTSGYLKRGRHYLPVRVYYEDTDAGGIVYHTNYLKYMERARTDFLRLIGIEQSRLIADDADPIKFAVKSLTIEYHQPARLDDALIVETQPATVKAASMTISQWIWRDKTLVANADFRVAVLNEQGAPKRLSKALREKLANPKP